MLVVLQTGRTELIIADLHKVCKKRVGKRYRESDQVLTKHHVQRDVGGGDVLENIGFEVRVTTREVLHRCTVRYLLLYSFPSGDSSTIVRGQFETAAVGTTRCLRVTEITLDLAEIEPSVRILVVGSY